MITGKNNNGQANNSNTQANRTKRSTIDVLAQYRQKIGSGLDKDIHQALIESFGERSGITPRIIEGKAMAIEIDILVFEKTVNKDIVVAAFLIDTPDVDLGNTNEKVNGRDVSVPIVLGDLIQSETVTMDSLTAHLNADHPDKEIIYSMVSVIPRLTLSRISNDGKLPKDVVQKLWVNIETSIVSIHNDIPLPLASIADTTRFVFRPEFSTDDVQSATGLPIHREWEVSLRAQSDNKNISKAKISTNQIVSLVGHTDLVYCGAPVPETIGGRPRANTWEYNLHITQSRSELGYSNLSTTLLALSTVPALFSGTTRFVPLKRALSSKTRNLMALNRDLTDKQLEFDVSEENFTLNMWKSIYLFDETKVILHIPECTEETTWLTMISQAPYDPAVNDAVITACREMNVTYDRDGNVNGNTFDQFWDGSQPIGEIDSDDVILNGYYNDENDVERDINSWTYLAARTDIENNRLFQDYDNTFHDTTMPIELRLSERVRILREQFPNVVFTGRSLPFRINPEFLKALWAANTASMKGKFTIENTHELEDINQRAGHQHRGSAGFSSDSFSFNNGSSPAVSSRVSPLRTFR